jgi:AraC family transcriptional regulator
MMTLPSGHYLGGTLRRSRLFGSPLTLSAYPAGHAYPWHVHEVPTFFVLLAGQHRDQNRRTSFDQSPLSVVFHPTIGPHATTVGPRGMVGINLELTDSWLERCHLQRSDFELDYQLLDSLCVRLLALRLAALAGEAGAADAEAETVALELVACLVNEPPAPARVPGWLPRAKEFLRCNSHAPISLLDVAAEAGVHPVYCARAFRRAVGCTVTAYLRTLRLLEAGRLALGEHYGLAEVALRAGFADQAHFTRTCSRELGFTPGKLQRLRRTYFPAAPAGSTRSGLARGWTCPSGHQN